MKSQIASVDDFF